MSAVSRSRNRSTASFQNGLPRRSGATSSPWRKCSPASTGRARVRHGGASGQRRGATESAARSSETGASREGRAGALFTTIAVPGHRVRLEAITLTLTHSAHRTQSDQDNSEFIVTIVTRRHMKIVTRQRPENTNANTHMKNNQTSVC